MKIPKIIPCNSQNSYDNPIIPGTILYGELAKECGCEEYSLTGIQTFTKDSKEHVFNNIILYANKKYPMEYNGRPCTLYYTSNYTGLVVYNDDKKSVDHANKLMSEKNK